MITISNYSEKAALVDFSKSKVLQEGDKFFREFSDLYNDDDDIKKAIDNHLKLVNAELSKANSSEKSKAVRGKTISNKPEKPRPTKDKAKPQGEPVNLLSPDVKFVRRYAALHGKVKTQEQLLAFLHSLQKAITEKVISAKSKFADEIMTIQNGLLKAVKAGGGKIEIESDALENYRAIANGQAVIASIPLLKKFILISGKPSVKMKAEKLLEVISNAKKKGLLENDPYAKKVEEIIKVLERYIDGKDDRPTIPRIELQGLYGLCGMEMPRPNLQVGKVVSSVDFMGAVFTVIPFSGRWKSLIGDPSDPFKLMFFGLPGNGKTTLAIQFAHYLASEHNKRVLFVSKEEGFVHTFQEKLTRLNASHHNLFVVDQIPLSLASYNAVFLDSVNSLHLSPGDLLKLYEKYPKTSFVCIHKVTKDGKFRGSQEYEHDVDVSVSCLNMVATAKKNRFGGNTHVKIIEAKGASISI